MPKQRPPLQDPSRSSGQGSGRARRRLAAVVLLGILTVYYGVYALAVYFMSPLDAISAAILAGVLMLVALAHGLSTLWVVRQRRLGHIVAVVVTALSALSGWVGMTWLELAALALNVVAFVLLLGCVPREPA